MAAIAAATTATTAAVAAASDEPLAVSFDDVKAAAERIKPYAHRTPVLTCATIDEMAGLRLFFKCENFQKVGAFKFRGAMNSVLQLPAGQTAVVTHSSGNHAQALALAARTRGLNAFIVMPKGAPAVKRQAVEGYGAKVIECENSQAAREAACARVCEETGAHLVPPYNYAHVIAGQGTAALELLEAVADLDAVITPVGGGGLLSGTCIAAKGVRPDIRVFAGEPAAADDAFRSLAAGQLLTNEKPPVTVADGLKTSLGDLTFAIIRRHVTAIVTVSEDEILAAMRLLWERMKIVVEPSSAVPLAAVLKPEFRAALGDGAKVGVIISGGNVDVAPMFAR